MAYTFAEKALARAAGLPGAVAGQIVDARPDVALSHDNSAAIAVLFRELGAGRVRYPERLFIVLDHAVPAPTTQHAANHAAIRRFVAEQGIGHFFDAGRGICHQVLSEEAGIWPGGLVLGADSHTTHAGWLGAFGAGIGRSEMAAIWATGQLWLRVPDTIRIDLTGALPPWVTAKDLGLWMLRRLAESAAGPEGRATVYAALEIGGPGLASLSIASRMVLPNLLAEAGVKNAYLEPDDAVFDWMARRVARARGEGEGSAAEIPHGAMRHVARARGEGAGNGEEAEARLASLRDEISAGAQPDSDFLVHARGTSSVAASVILSGCTGQPAPRRAASEESVSVSPKGLPASVLGRAPAGPKARADAAGDTLLIERIAAGALYPDADAIYSERYTVDLAEVEPAVACPHRPDQVVPIGQVAGTPVQQAFIGTCTNGRLEDLAAAAAVLRGPDGRARHVAPGTRLLIIPASSLVLREAIAAGYVETFLAAGAMIGTPGCGPCMGNHLGIPAPGEATISSANRNFRGRMGTPEAEIYLASPAVVAASAVAGRIADPREVSAREGMTSRTRDPGLPGPPRRAAATQNPPQCHAEFSMPRAARADARNSPCPPEFSIPPGGRRLRKKLLGCHSERPCPQGQLTARHSEESASGVSRQAESLTPGDHKRCQAEASAPGVPRRILPQPHAALHVQGLRRCDSPRRESSCGPAQNDSGEASVKGVSGQAEPLLSGRAWKYGDDVNTDVIFPGKYTYTITDPAEMARHALEDLDPAFAGAVRPGDILVGGRNWGCGSSREQAATCLREAGVRAIVAASFARIFFRNAVNSGLLPVACPAAAEAIRPGETVTVDVERCAVSCAAGEFSFPPLSPSLREIVAAGGLIPMLRNQLARQERAS
jgi:3-isopropylmalate dehydratase small subunit